MFRVEKPGEIDTVEYLRNKYDSFLYNVGFPYFDGCEMELESRWQVHSAKFKSDKGDWFVFQNQKRGRSITAQGTLIVCMSLTIGLINILENTIIEHDSIEILNRLYYPTICTYKTSGDIDTVEYCYNFLYGFIFNL